MVMLGSRGVGWEDKGTDRDVQRLLYRSAIERELELPAVVICFPFSFS